LISRWVIENTKEGSKSNINYDEDRELEKSEFVSWMKMLLTNKNEMSNYHIFKETEIEDLKKQIWKELHSYKNSIEETIKLDDENNKGFVSLEGLKESFEIMEIKMNDWLEEFMYYFLFLKSQNVERIEYKPLIDLISQPVVESNIDKRPI